jgi:hypothetical protein
MLRLIVLQKTEKGGYGMKLQWEEARQLMLEIKNEVNIRCFILSRPCLRSIEFLPSSGFPGPAEGCCACSGILLAMVLQV